MIEKPRVGRGNCLPTKIADSNTGRHSRPVMRVSREQWAPLLPHAGSFWRRAKLLRIVSLFHRIVHAQLPLTSQVNDAPGQRRIEFHSIHLPGMSRRCRTAGILGQLSRFPRSLREGIVRRCAAQLVPQLSGTRTSAGLASSH